MAVRERLFDLETQRRKHREKRFGIIIGVLIAGTVLGFLFAETGAGADMAVFGGLLGGAVGLVWAVRAGVPTPTLRCAACRRAGWIVDIKPTDGSCPACGHGQFIVSGKQRSGRRLRQEAGDTASGGAILAGEVSVDGEGGDGGDGGDGDGGDGGGDGD